MSLSEVWGPLSQFVEQNSLEHKVEGLQNEGFFHYSAILKLSSNWPECEHSTLRLKIVLSNNEYGYSSETIREIATTSHLKNEEDGASPIFFLFLEKAWLMAFVPFSKNLRAIPLLNYTPSEIIALISQIIERLEFVHAKNCVYANLSAESIAFYSSDQLALIDYRATRFLYFATMENFQREWPNDPRYRAPEMWAFLPIGKEADIWALGVLIYYFITARFPFELKDLTWEQGEEALTRIFSVAAPSSLKSPSLIQVYPSLEHTKWKTDNPFQKLPAVWSTLFMKIFQLEASNRPSLQSIRKSLNAIARFCT